MIEGDNISFKFSFPVGASIKPGNYLHDRFKRLSMTRKISFHIQPLIILFMAGLLISLSGCADEEKQIPPPEIFLPNENEEIEVSQGDSIKLEPKITYNIDASYIWKKNGKQLDYNQQFLSDTASQLGRIEYFFSVTTPYGSDSATIPVDVIILADFQDLEMPADQDTAWVGAEGTGGYAHKNLYFPNEYENDSVWNGFGYSNMESTTSTLPLPRHHVYAHKSVLSDDDSDNIFALVSQENPDDVPSFSFTDGKEHHLKSIKIANSTLGHYRMKFGDDHFERLGGPTSDEPDWCRVTLRGLDKNSQKTGEIIFYLADYRFDNNKRDYIVDKWQEIELQELNAVNKVELHLSTSKTNDNGAMITPGTFCLDELKIKD